MNTPKTSFAYCTGRDQMVRVVRKWELLEKAPPHRGWDDPSQLVCLDYGGGCTGSLCPLFHVPTPEMERRLVEVGLWEPPTP